ncbi:MAG: PIN domain-containing protein [Actinomycetota bacterium]
MAILLDTTVLIDVLRGRPAATRLRRMRGSEDPPFVCAINVEELTRGIRPRESRALLKMLDGVRIAPLGRTEAETAGRWRREFAARGTTLSQSDCLIAAAAVGMGARLATGNPKDFPMKELVVEHWPVGE